MNKSRLHEVLTIKNQEKEKIVSVIGRMELLLEFFNENKKYHSLIPFLTTYYLVTKAVTAKYITHKHYFQKIEDLENLDVYFASLYFTPLLAFLESGVKHKPWETYFSYCTQPHSSPFLQILLGINAHINTDLYASLVHLEFNNQKDYSRINDILGEVLPQVMKFLFVSEHDFFGLGGIIFTRFIQREFHKVIVGWRKDAWANAMQTNAKNQRTYYRTIENDTESLASELINIIH